MERIVTLEQDSRHFVFTIDRREALSFWRVESGGKSYSPTFSYALHRDQRRQRYEFNNATKRMSDDRARSVKAMRDFYQPAAAATVYSVVANAPTGTPRTQQDRKSPRHIEIVHRDTVRFNV